MFWTILEIWLAISVIYAVCVLFDAVKAERNDRHR